MVITPPEKTHFSLKSTKGFSRRSYLSSEYCRYSILFLGTLATWDSGRRVLKKSLTLPSGEKLPH
ncbi:MAG: hypothetical protein B7Y39_10200 [Bdellovibrio sp. 28-41-41]|nr:MAG: hypothetical protein B7Y39_10200 [Bdellovibrio sp. 28-41-41]